MVRQDEIRRKDRTDQADWTEGSDGLSRIVGMRNNGEKAVLRYEYGICFARGGSLI